MKPTTYLLPTTATTGYAIPDKKPRRHMKTVAMAAAGLCLGGVLLSGASHVAPKIMNRVSSHPAPEVNVCETSHILTYDQLHSCVKSLPYNATEKAELVEYYRRALPLYVFESISKDAHAFGPYETPAVDLQSELNAIEATEYENDAEMQTAFFSLINKLNDAHTTHAKPYPYYSYYALQPISLLSVERHNRQVIQLRDVDSAEVETYRTLYPSTPVDFDVSGWDVLSIDGVPAIDALSSFADGVGLLKDAGGRFNLAVSGYKTGRGWFVFRSMGTFDVPTQRRVTYELRHPTTRATKTVAYDWLALNMATKSDDRSKHNKKYDTLFEKLKDHFISHELFETPPAVEYMDAVGENAAVLKLNAFSGGDDDLTFEDVFAANVTSALAHICLGYATLRYLFPNLDVNGPHEAKGPHQDGVYRARRTELSETIATILATMQVEDPTSTTFLAPTQFYSPSTQRQFRDASWMTNGESTVLGEMSQGVYRGCADTYVKYPAPGVSFSIAPENLLVVSQGFCGSTCAVFTSYIQAYNLGQTVALGGYLHTPQQPFGFPGGQVGQVSAFTELGNAISGASELGVDLSPVVPQPPTSGRVDTLPLEYTFVPATHSILYPSDPLDYDAIYAKVLQVTSSSQP
ncbi:hypothetical protein SPRG_02903 [Saprolegnia parasitica CBS 223.65]|uniref:Tail specific protease domain-containing protein n=1 Tax=Saprolegnia parasitica (strain CBS 223.65) TaxID=695850 RepID=A0A067D0X5_SAPPC|nr:hypothetical protein SPRG_02903 [Saprolegnia parasitica CBS 223.65]KDO32426.1 hypothetical protein SPRG_02903 [Saprolegnia parasitica CBS 223.65]|eukprot:XP_012196880.1 hypothetical protein SPRG_02903 [Saprolegnia parasitica CBS 223.65]